MHFLLAILIIALPTAAVAHDTHEANAGDCGAPCLPRYVDAIEWTASTSTPADAKPKAEVGPPAVPSAQDLTTVTPRASPRRSMGH